MFILKRLILAAKLLSLSIFLLLSCSDSSTESGDDSNGGDPASCERTPLPPPSGTTVVVSTTMELIDAVNNANFQGGQHHRAARRRNVYVRPGACDQQRQYRHSWLVRRSRRRRGPWTGYGGERIELFLVLSDGFVVADMTMGWVSDHAIDFLRNGDNHVVHYDRHPTYTAIFYARLGDKDQAFAWLEKAYEKHDGPLYLLKVSPWWDPLRDDPRYHDVLRRINFPQNETQQ